MAEHYDYLVLGAGISGAAAAYELSASGSTALIEAEAMPGYHSTGRSAALYTRNYGGPVVRCINRTSHAFFTHPPSGFSAYPLLTPRGALTVAAPGEEQALAPLLELADTEQAIEIVTADRALELVPLLRPQQVAAAVFEAGVMDIDVDAMHQGYLRGFKARGGQLLCQQRVASLSYRNSRWQLKPSLGNNAISGRVIVNATGAWAEQLGAIAGAAAIGLVAKRRTAIIVDAPQGINVAAMPAVDDAASAAYFKPDAGRIMASPGDQTPTEPQDAQPDEWDVAVLMDWLERKTLIPTTRIAHRWAGLRSFVADGNPVLGFDTKAPDFFWLAGQGGYGIMMAPALGRATASLINTGTLPADLRASSITANDLSPARLANH